MLEGVGKKVIIYRDEGGKEPFVQWIESIKDIMTRARIKNRLRRLEFGNFGDCKSLGRGLFELRMDFGPGYRVYIGNEDVIVILLCGGDKHSQAKDVMRAYTYLEHYKNMKRYEKNKNI